MRELNEWKYEFSVEAPEPVNYDMMSEGLMWETCVSWAEDRGLGVGGGCFASDGGSCKEPRKTWRFEFGLSRGIGSTPESDAAELWSVIARWCEARGFLLAGEFGPYPSTG